VWQRNGNGRLSATLADALRRDTTVARLTVARKIGKRAFHVLRELELASA
jgi:hypothetical protein